MFYGFIKPFPASSCKDLIYIYTIIYIYATLSLILDILTFIFSA